MRITDNENISETLEKDYGTFVICDTDRIREFVTEIRSRMVNGDDYLNTGNLRNIRVVTSEISCAAASRCGDKNIFEIVYEIWFDRYCMSKEMEEILKCIDEIHQIKIALNSTIGASAMRYNTEILDKYNKIKEKYRDKLFAYMEKRSDTFNKESVTSITF